MQQKHLHIRQIHSKCRDCSTDLACQLFLCDSDAVLLQEAPQTDISAAAMTPRGVDWLMTSLVFLFPAVGGLLFGYDIGATSGALVSITSQQTSGTDW